MLITKKIRRLKTPDFPEVAKMAYQPLKTPIFSYFSIRSFTNSFGDNF